MVASKDTGTGISQFTLFMVLASLFGIYIPGAVKSFPPFMRRFDFCYWYCIFAFSSLAFVCVDIFWIVLHRLDDLGIAVSLHMISCLGLAIWMVIYYSYILLNYKKMDSILTFWANDLQQHYRPEIRKAYLQIAYKKVLKKAFITSTFLILPYFLSMIYNIAMGEIYFASNFGYGLTIYGNRFLAAIQALGVFFFASGYTWQHCFSTLLLRLITVEQDCLKEMIKEAFPKFRTEIKDYPDECEIKRARKLLVDFVKYHAQLIEFHDKINKYYSGILVSEFMLLTIIVCGLAFTGTMMKIPLKFVGYGMVTASTLSIMFMQLCRIGDEIKLKNEELGYLCFHCSFMMYPKDIQKSLIFIAALTNHKPMIINYHGMCKLLSTDYRQMTLLQYKFYCFMLDTVKG